MHLYQSMSMVSLEDLAIVLQSRMSEIFMISASYTWVVKIISWFFVSTAPTPLLSLSLGGVSPLSVDSSRDCSLRKSTN